MSFGRSVSQGARAAKVYLGQRFGELPEDVRLRIHKADMEHLQRWTDRVIPARVLADVFE